MKKNTFIGKLVRYESRNCSLTFYVDENGTYFYSEAEGMEKMKAGTMEDVEEVIKAYA